MFIEYNFFITAANVLIMIMLGHYMVLQKSNWDFMNPIQIQLTYDLSDVGEPSMMSGAHLPDINNYPVVNRARAEKNLSVSSFLLLFHKYH